MHQLFFAQHGELLHLADDGADVAHCFDDIARARFALGANHRCAFGNAPERFAEIARAADERNLVAVLPDVMLFVGGREDFALVDVVHFESFEDLCFGEMADADFGHHRDRNDVHDFADDSRRGHASDAAFFANVRGDALERHHGAGAGVFRDFGLGGGGDVHDHAAFQHFGEADFYAPEIVAHQVHRSSPFCYDCLFEIRIPKSFKPAGLKTGATKTLPWCRYFGALDLEFVWIDFDEAAFAAGE